MCIQKTNAKFGTNKQYYIQCKNAKDLFYYLTLSFFICIYIVQDTFQHIYNCSCFLYYITKNYLPLKERKMAIKHCRF